MLKTLNLNADVKVKLTEIGRRAYHKHQQTLVDIGYSTSKEIADIMLAPLPEDENGYVTLQLWELMMFFGSKTYLGCQPMFDMNVLIDEKELEEMQ